MQVLMKGHEQRSEHLCSVFPVDFTVYIVQFTVGQQKWEVRKRYSEFVKLYNLLESKFGFETIEKLPEIPPKKFLLALSPSLIKERQNAFADFLKEVVKNPGMNAIRIAPYLRITHRPQIFAKVPTSSNLFKCLLMCLRLMLKASGKRPLLARILIELYLQMCIVCVLRRAGHPFGD
jgi:hypothetical protein